MHGGLAERLPQVHMRSLIFTLFVGNKGGFPSDPCLVILYIMMASLLATPA